MFLKILKILKILKFVISICIACSIVPLRKYYFPLWEDEEILALRKHAFPNQDESEVVERLQTWGGVPRHVLTHPEPDWQSELKRAADSTDVNMLQHMAFVDVLSEGQLSNRTFLIKTHAQNPDGGNARLATRPEFYMFWHMEVCSSQIAIRLANHFVAFSNAQSRHMAGHLQSHPGTSSMAGALIESLARDELLRGGRFEVRRLNAIHSASLPASSSSLEPLELHELPTFRLEDLASTAVELPDRFAVTVPASEQRTFSEIEHLSAVDASSTRRLRWLLYSTNPNQTGFDFVLPGSILANVTINTSHPLHLSGEKNRGIVEAWQRLHSPDLEPQKLTSISELRRIRVKYVNCMDAV